MKKTVLILLVLSVKIWAFSADYKSFSANFKQVVSNKNSKITYTGKLIITQNKGFWDYESPAKKQIYIDKENITIVEPDLEQVIITKLSKVPNLSEIFKSAKRGANGRFEADYEGVKYLVDIKNNEISSISYKDDLDNEISIFLSAQKRDFSVNESIFTPKYPAHFDILR